MPSTTESRLIAGRPDDPKRIASPDNADDLVSAYFEAPPQSAGAFDPVAVVNRCIESGSRDLLFDDGSLPPEFFDLSTRVAGAMVQRLTQYGIRTAAVVPDPSAYSRPFQDFAREANAGSHFRFFPTRQQAIDWLIAE